MYRIGIDLGGTNIKGGIVDESGKIIIKKSVPTECENGSKAVVANMIKLAEMLISDSKIERSKFCGVGVGCPGMVDGKTGVVKYSNNLKWKDVTLAADMGSALKMPVNIANDANAAALGEYKYGNGKQYKSIILFTLGTGVGGGIIIDGVMLEGHCGAGAEVGHVVIIEDGEQCSCGRKGCMEAYSSATALIRDTKRAMEKDKASLMWKVAGTLDDVDGKTAFDAEQMGDKSAKAVLDDYAKHLAEGIVNMANVIRPEAVLLGGGVAASGDKIIKRLQKLCDERIYGGKLVPCLITTASLGNDAGLLGAAALI